MVAQEIGKQILSGRKITKQEKTVSKRSRQACKAPATTTDHTRAETEIRARAHQQAVVADLGQHALAGAELSVLMNEAVALVAQTLGVQYCKVLELLPDDNALLLRAGVGWQEGLVGQATVGASTDLQTGYTLLSSEPVIVEDLRTETRFNGPPLLNDHGVVSGMSVIILGQERPFGVLGAYTTKRRTFTKDDIHFLQAVANVLAMAIERRRAEEVLRRSGAWRQSLIDTTQDAVISIDHQGRIVLFNSAAERIFGYTQAEVQGQQVNLLMPEPYASEHEGYIARYEQTGEPHALGRIRTVAAQRKNGEVFPIELSLTEVTVDEEVRYAALIRDISEKVRLQEQLIERERLAAIGTTAAKLAHEIGNPLNAMYMTTQLLERRLTKQLGNLDDKISSTIRNLMDEIVRLNQLLQEYRSLSRRQQPSLQPTDLVTLVVEALTAETPHYTACGIRVEHAFPADLPPVMADSEKLKQVVLNLCKNAVEAMPHGGTLTVRAYNSGEQVSLEVRDTGVGIPAGADVFAPFTTTKPQGTGLGLAIVQQIMAAHKGTVTYTSELDQGTTFTLVLPISPLPPTRPG